MQDEIIKLIEARLIEAEIERQIEAEIERQRAIQQQQTIQQNDLEARAIREQQNASQINLTTMTQTYDAGAQTQ